MKNFMDKVKSSCGNWWIVLIPIPVGIAFAFFFPVLKQPIRINLPESWVILTLTSMLALTYVQLINRLKDNKHKLTDRRKKINDIIRALGFTTVMIFFSTSLFVVRIIWLCFYPWDYDKPSLEVPTLAKIDWVFIISFLIFSIQSVILFFYSYGKDIFCYRNSQP